MDHEGVRTEVLSADEQLGHHNGMVCSATKRSNPPLGGSQGRRVNGEGLVIGIPGGGGLETTNVRAMAQFCLRVATDDLVFGGTLKEELVLFWGTLFTEGDLKVGLPVSIGLTVMRVMILTRNMLAWRP